MKTLVISLFILIGMGINTTSAQIDNYKETKTFHMIGYTYQCDVPIDRLVTLYNKENKFTYKEMRFKDTGEIYSVLSHRGLKTLEDDTWTWNKCQAIVGKAFTEKERQRMNDTNLGITMIINSETGKVIEVEFTFFNFSPLATMPVSAYRSIEVELKKEIWFTPTEEGKRLNYILLTWGQNPKYSIRDIDHPISP